MPLRTRPLLVGVSTAASLLAAPASQGDEAKDWKFDVALNLFMSGFSGDVAVRGVPAGVDATFRSIFEHLEASAAGRVTVGYQRWLFSTEFSYLKLGAEPRGAKFDMEQWLVEPTLGYAVNSHAHLFAGARYVNIDGNVHFNGPLGRVDGGTQDWWDPIVGIQLAFPLVKDSLAIGGRFDVGGFSAGSDFTWQAYPHLNWRFARGISAQLGYRWLGFDYETGSGSNRFVLDAVFQGPQIGLSAHF